MATFSSVRSANRSARAAERSLLIGLRPILMPSRRDDPPQKIMYGDEQWFKMPGGTAVGEIRTVKGTENVYLALSLHNAGSGLGVVHGWVFYPERPQTNDHPPLEKFRWNSRDLWIPVNDTGFWQAAYRDPGDPEYAAALEAIKNRQPIGIDLLYGDHEGGQRVVTRFSVTPRTDTTEDAEHNGQWIASAVRHWNIDRPDPRVGPRTPQGPEQPAGT